MKSSLGFLILSVHLLISAVIVSPANAQEIDSAEFWTAAEVTGSVMVRAGNNAWSESKQLTQGQRIGPYSTIEAGADGQAILVRSSGDRITLFANSEIELPGTDRSSGLSRILQMAGDVLFRVRNRDQRAFEVETPFLVAGVRGTTFGISATDATSKVHIVEGSVSVDQTGSNAGQPTILYALEEATAGLGLQTQLTTAPTASIEMWDNRSFSQAESVDRIAQTGPAPLQAAIILNDPGAPATDLEDLTVRISNRETVALERATREPTARNQAIAETAKASAIRLASAGIAAPGTGGELSNQDSEVEKTVLPAPTAAPATPAPATPAPVSPAPVSPAVVTPAPAAPQVTPTEPAVLQTPSNPVEQSPAPERRAAAGQPRVIAPGHTGNATEETEQTSDDPLLLPSEETAGDANGPTGPSEGVVYTTYGITGEEDAADGSAAETEPATPALNIEGLGSGN